MKHRMGARRPDLARRGTLYVAVIGVTMIVGMIALASATVGRLELKGATSRVEQREARLLAQSGVEYGMSWVNNPDNDWRNTLTSGVEQGPTTLAGGTFAWSVTAEDGDLVNAGTVTLRGVGRVGAARAVEEVTLDGTGMGIDSLAVALHSNADWVANGTAVSTNQTVSSNGNIDASSGGSDITGNAWAGGSIQGQGNVSGSASSNQTPLRTMPGADVFDYYKTNGTWISISDLPQMLGKRLITAKLVSPASAALGATNPQGIYVIDCQGERVDISYSRVVGTLVLLNPHADSRISGPVNWEPAVANFPALLVEGDFEIDMTGFTGERDLLESGFTGSLNPPGTPYEGVEDTDDEDSYPGLIQGLVYVSGQLEIANSGFGSGETAWFEGAVVCGSLLLNDDAEFDYSSLHLLAPPPGFANDGGMKIRARSWRRAAF